MDISKLRFPSWHQPAQLHMHQCMIWLPNISVTLSHLNEEMGSNYTKATRLLPWDAEKSARVSECWVKSSLSQELKAHAQGNSTGQLILKHYSKTKSELKKPCLKTLPTEFTSWKECLMADQKSSCTLQGVQKGRHKGQYHLSDWKLQSWLQFVAVFKSASCFNRSLICVSGIGMNGLVFQAL